MSIHLRTRSYFIRTLIEDLFCWLDDKNFQTLGSLVKVDLKRLLMPEYKGEGTQKVVDFIISYPDFENFALLFREIFVQQSYKIELSSLRPRIVDVGSNIGLSVLFFKWMYPNAEITAFEPAPDSYDFLQKNIMVNGLENVFTHNYAVHDFDGVTAFYKSRNRLASVSNSLVDSGDTNTVKTEVECRRLSHFLDERVDLLKIDAEGAELNIWSELEKERKLNMISNAIIEYHHGIPGREDKFSQFLAILEREGFTYSIKTGFGKPGFAKPGGFQGIMIYASRGQT